MSPAYRPSMLMLALGLAAAALLVSAPAGAKTLEVGEGKTYKMPSDAIKDAQDGDKILIAAGEYFDCAIVRTNNLTIEGAGPNGTAIMTDKACGGKGLLVTDGDSITIRNLTLTRARVPDGNGAGIRSEGKDLLVDHVKFINNQNGILSNDQPDGSITVRDSEFTKNGSCDGACAHGIYAGKLKLLHVEHSTFTETRQAHHVKSRAQRTEVIGCTFTDGPNGTASYEIDIPNGGSLVARDNTIDKGPKAENHTAAIIIGEEGVTQPTREIVIANNTMRNSGSYGTFLVYNLTATEAMLTNNKLSGSVQPLHGDGEVK